MKNLFFNFFNIKKKLEFKIKVIIEMEKNIAYIDLGEGQISFGKKNFNKKNEMIAVIFKLLNKFI